MSLRIARLVVCAGLCIAGVGVSMAAYADPPEVKRELLDTTAIEQAQRKALDQTVGYAPAPIDSDLRWVGTDAISWESLRGKVVVIQSWTRASEAGRMAPARTHALLKDFKPEDVQVVALHTPEGAEGVEDFLARKPSKVPVLVDAKGYFCDDMGVEKKPLTIVLDRQGAVRYAGASLGGLKDAVKHLTAEAFDDKAAAPAPVPARDARTGAEEEVGVGGGSDTGSKAGGRFPRHNPDPGAADLQGKKAPKVEVEKWLNGQPDMSNKVVILDFWATWCGPCRASIPHVNGIQRKFKDSVVVIGLTNEEASTVTNFMNKTEMNYTVATDTKGRTSSGFGVQGIPSMAVISPDGVVRWQGHPAELSDAIVKQVVTASGAGAKPAEGGASAEFRWAGPRPTESASAE